MGIIICSSHFLYTKASFPPRVQSMSGSKRHSTGTADVQHATPAAKYQRVGKISIGIQREREREVVLAQSAYWNSSYPTYHTMPLLANIQSIHACWTHYYPMC